MFKRFKEFSLVFIIGLTSCVSQEGAKETTTGVRSDSGQVAEENDAPILTANPFYWTPEHIDNQKVMILDGTIEKYQGKYLLTGYPSNGNGYFSKDLRYWSEPYELISSSESTLPEWVSDPAFENNDQYVGSRYKAYGAGDVVFHNGVFFHVFNGVGLIHGKPETIYDEPEFFHSLPEHPYGRGIDPQFFVAHDGTLLYIRKVQPFEFPRAEGIGEAWFWKVGDSFLNAPYKPGEIDATHGHEVLSGEKGRWEAFNKFNFEGPEMYYRNGQYYLLFVGNHFSPRTGLYDTGVAQNADYKTMSNADKYPGKLLTRNLERLLLKYTPILPTSEHGAQEYRLTFSKPDSNWDNPAYDDSNWTLAEGGFGYPEIEQSTVIPSIVNNYEKNNGKKWGHEEGPAAIWLRRSFNLDTVPERIILRHHFEALGTLSVNGHVLIDRRNDNSPERGFQNTEIPQHMLRKGENVVAVAARTMDEKKFHQVDFGVYDTNGEPYEPDIVIPSQPNILKGLNGFETWVVYKALWNNDNGQGKDRIYFWDDEMVTEGPTAKSSPVKPLESSAPSLTLDFNNTDKSKMEARRTIGFSKNGELSMSGESAKHILFSTSPIANGYVESHVQFAGVGQDDLAQASEASRTGLEMLAGIIAWYQDDDSWVEVLLDRVNDSVVVVDRLEGIEKRTTYALPDSFAFLDDDSRIANFKEPFHPLRVYRNGNSLFAEVGHYKVNNDQPIFIDDRIDSAGRMGLVSRTDTDVLMDNVSMTRGFEENDAYINGWDKTWSVTETGLKPPTDGRQISIKGDGLLNYEFSVNASSSTLPSRGYAGVVVHWVDEKNYMLARTNFREETHELVHVKDGKSTVITESSAYRDVTYGHSNHKGDTQTQYEYDLRAESRLSMARILWHSGFNNYLSVTYRLPNVESENFGIEYFDGGQWTVAPVAYDFNGRGRFHDATFNADVTADRVRLNVPEGENRPFSFVVREEVSAQNFYRVAKEGGRVMVWVNNELQFDVVDPLAGEPGRVGLYAENVDLEFDSITHFERVRF
ncbi:hypothetical protein EDC38_2331 [Marinimicrobium koreense]|uniref:Uncharacterized protein n=1 Tax=Marinimicrobium koreense TaxID=306545 RepID=A0A3N1NZS9_9GAMM|nr:hypothetical protein [Marinimicrobium koreense]ROQ21705.1 hypothetical protein EDC38_2331 [Marinimicrobium koreense]